MFIAMLIAKVICNATGFDKLAETNLTFYLAVFTLLYYWQILCRNTFKTGWFTFNDETKVQLLYSLKSFVVVWALFTYTEGSASSFLGLDLEKNHQVMVERANRVFALSGGRLELAPEYSNCVLALLAALISFAVVKINVNFAFYFFVINRTASNTP